MEGKNKRGRVRDQMGGGEIGREGGRGRGERDNYNYSVLKDLHLKCA